MIVAFEFVPAKDQKDWPILDALECNSIPTALTTEPKPFKVGFRIRDKKALDRWIQQSDERTKNL
jgi:phenylacetate 2-hydroxylase